MRKNNDFKTYGRHRNRVICTADVWGSDNDRRKNVFGTSSSSELDSSKHSSLFQISSSSNERSNSYLFESAKKTRQTSKPFDNKENIPGTRVTRRKACVKHAAQSRATSESGSDASYEVVKKSTRRALRDRNNKVDYNDSANLKKQLKGTTAKRKRAVKTNKKNQNDASSVNFSEFEDYSLVVISDSPAGESGKQARNNIETSTPVAKRTRCQENTFEKIRNSDLSHIETVSSPMSEISYSVYTPASSLQPGFTSSNLSTPSILSSVALSNHNSNSASKIELDSCSNSRVKSLTPENAVVQVERLRQSFILKHVSGRRKASNVISPEDVSLRLQSLANSLSNSTNNRKPLIHSGRKNTELNENSLSLFDSPHILTRNRCKQTGKVLNGRESHRKDSSSEAESGEESEDLEEEESEDSDEEEDDNVTSEENSVEVDNLSAISENEDENETSEDDDDESSGESQISEQEESVEVDDIDELQNSIRDLGISDNGSRQSGETLYMLNDDYVSNCSSGSSSANSAEISVSRDLFSPNKISLISSKNSSKSDYFTASSSHLLDEEYETAYDDDSCGSDGKRVGQQANQVVDIRDEDSVCHRERRSYSLRGKGLMSLQDSFAELLTPSKKKGSIVPLSARTKLLVLCDQSMPITFDEAIPNEMMSQCKKIGEGVYGEVFRTQSEKNSVALKGICADGEQAKVFGFLKEERKCSDSLVVQGQINGLLRVGICADGEQAKVFGFLKEERKCSDSLVVQGQINGLLRLIIPIEGDFPVNDEPQKKFDEILPEVVIAKELSSLRNCKTSMTANFCEVRRAALVKGKYSPQLLKEWDIFNKKKRSENDRPGVIALCEKNDCFYDVLVKMPDMFTDSQLFIMFEFADCGRDLESYEFENMQQARSVLAQVVYALAVAEESLQFEHRDLHWGNVLVKPTDQEDITFKLMGRRCSVPSMGVEANIIDFTMSRLTKDKCSVYTDLSSDDSLFEGKGDYQFDIYRKMKEENSNDWEKFTPRSNVCWLHYLADKLVYAKRFPSHSSRQERDVLRQFRQFLGTILDYQSACEMAVDADFLNS